MSVHRIVYLYDLKKGVTMEEYRKFALADSKITPKQSGVLSFEAFEIHGTNRKDIRCTIMEVVNVSSYSQWRKVLKTKEMLANDEQLKNLIDESSILMWYGSNIVKDEDFRHKRRKQGWRGRT